MGQIAETVESCDTGAAVLQIRVWDRLILLLLLVVGVESALYYADYWFLGGHRKNILLFVILSYAVFRGVVRSVLGWGFLQFIRLPKPVALAQVPSVDVLTTAMPGEPFAMFATTLKAIQQMRIPHVTYLLDGGGDPALRSLCDSLGVIHVDCTGIRGAKAGKINHCLTTMAQGEFVLVIDPDHIPEPDFLDRALPCFSDKRIGFVQVVQAYYNRNQNVVAKAAAEQTYGFYGPLMMSLNGLDMPLCIGANCLFRRAALDSIGGHAVHLAEDACTSMRIHAAGWKSRYLPFRGSYGLVPEDLQTFFKQQIKWATGMFDLFLHEYPRRFSGLNLSQRLYYLFAGTFYLGGVVNFLTILIPIVFLFFQIYAVEMPLAGFLLHAAPYAICFLGMSLFIQRFYSAPDERGFPWRSMLLEKGTWPVYFMAFVYAVTGKKIPYLPTPKQGGSRVNWHLLLPHLVAVVLSFAAMLFPLFYYHRIDYGTQLMMGFAFMNVVTLLPILIWGIAERKGRMS